MPAERPRTTVGEMVGETVGSKVGAADGLLVHVGLEVGVEVVGAADGNHVPLVQLIRVTPGRKRLSSHPQSSKPSSPMEVTEFGIATVVRLVQPRKASSPMEVTEFGIATVVRLVHSRKA